MGRSCARPVSDETMLEILCLPYYSCSMYPGNIVQPCKFQEKIYAQQHCDSEDDDNESAHEWLSNAKVGEMVHVFMNSGNGSATETYEKMPNGWTCIHVWDEQEINIVDDGPYLYRGIRSDVAKVLGVGVSAYFHVLFDEAVNKLFFD